MDGASRAHARRLDSDGGTSLIEICIGMFVLLVAIVGVVGSMGGGMTLVGHSRQRSAGVALAQEKLEQVHRYPYERIAINNSLAPLPISSTDPTNPDSEVSVDNVSYRGEPLVMAADGVVDHVLDPVTVGRTEFNVYQYVTWVNDPSVIGIQDHKRVVVIVTWKHSVNGGPSNRIEQSTLLSSGTVTLPAASPSPTTFSGPTASPTASPTPTVPVVTCEGDVAAPSDGALSIVSGSGATTGFTNSTTVSVNVTAVDGCAPLTAELSNDDATFSAVSSLTSGEASAPTWTIPSGDGEKTVYARFRDGLGNVSPVVSATITLDQTAPAAPSSLAQAFNGCTTSGSDRTVTLTWTAPGDAGGDLLGYRLYRSVQTLGYGIVANPSSTSATDTHNRNSLPVAFKVRAYDRAGNESEDSNVITYSTNRC